MGDKKQKKIDSKCDIMLSDETKQKRKGAIFHEYYNIKYPLSSTGFEIFFQIWSNKSFKSYKVSRNAIYEWRAKYDGKSWKSLVVITTQTSIHQKKKR